MVAMRRIIFTLLCLVLAVPAHATLTFYWRVESATFDGTHDYSAGDTTPTDSTPLSYNSTQVFAGTNAAEFDSFEHTVFSSASILSASEGVFAAAFYNAAWSDGGELFAFWDNSANQDRISLTVLGSSGSGNIRLRISEQGVGATNIDTTGLNLSQDTWYFIIARWDEAATTGRVEVYNSSGTLLGSAENTSVTAAWPTVANMDEFILGDIGTGTAGWFDNVFAADDYAEAVEDFYDITSYTEYGGGSSIIPIFQHHQLQRMQ